MKNICLLLFLHCLIFNPRSTIAQTGQWVWLQGSNTPGSLGVYGNKGVENANNEPPAVYEPCEWTDTAGYFWIYGGKDANQSFRNDLFRYNPGNNEWTWMSGTNTTTDPGVFGTQGVPSPSNHPPPLGYGVASWVDFNNNLWLCGGFDPVGSGIFIDLWKYDIAANEWTWMKGPGTPFPAGVYGTQGVPDTGNYPGYRIETSAAWTDNADNLWLFGGQGNGSLNDLWRYNIATNTWTWMKGSQYGFGSGTYGTQGVEDSANTPGGRLIYSHWKDKSGNLWLFGGGQEDFYDHLHTENDLWRYNIATNNWAWINGDSTADIKNGFYGTKCTISPSNMPSSRYENRASWTDAKGNFWTFGGAFNDSIRPNADTTYLKNDLWMYCVSSNQWTWVSGDSTFNPAGNWGTIRIPGAANKPSGRFGSIGWTDRNGNLYLFAGAYSSYESLVPYNDVWKYVIDSTCSVCAVALPPVASFESSDTVFCAYTCVNFTDLSTSAIFWKWSFPGAVTDTSTSKNPQGICYDSAGIYNVTLEIANALGADTLTLTSFINVFTSPPTPVITKSNDTLFCSTDPSYISFQWFLDTALIAGATDSFLVITKGGNYNVSVLNNNGCSTADGINVTFTGLEALMSSGSAITVFPNPAADEIIINGNWKSSNGIMTIYNVLGEKVQEEKTNLSGNVAINIKNLSVGIYFISVQDESGRWGGRFVKE